MWTSWKNTFFSILSIIFSILSIVSYHKIYNDILHTCYFLTFSNHRSQISYIINWQKYQTPCVRITAQFANISTLRAMRFHSGSGWDLLIWSQIPLEDETRGAIEVVVLHKKGGTFGSCLLPSNASTLPFPVSTRLHPPSDSKTPPLRTAFPAHAAAFDLVHFKCDLGVKSKL